MDVDDPLLGLLFGLAYFAVCIILVAACLVVGAVLVLWRVTVNVGRFVAGRVNERAAYHAARRDINAAFDAFERGLRRR